jgi:hypothetical protein
MHARCCKPCEIGLGRMPAPDAAPSRSAWARAAAAASASGAERIGGSIVVRWRVAPTKGVERNFTPGASACSRMCDLNPPKEGWLYTTNKVLRRMILGTCPLSHSHKTTKTTGRARSH